MRWLMRARGSEGFTIVDVLMAAVLMVVATMGLVGLFSSSTNLSSISQQTRAAQQFARTVDENIKMIPFYQPYTGTQADVDDFFWGSRTPVTTNTWAGAPEVDDTRAVDADPMFKCTIKMVYLKDDLTEGTMIGTWGPTISGHDKPTSSANAPFHIIKYQIRVSWIPGGTGGTNPSRASYAYVAFLTDTQFQANLGVSAITNTDGTRKGTQVNLDPAPDNCNSAAHYYSAGLGGAVNIPVTIKGYGFKAGATAELRRPTGAEGDLNVNGISFVDPNTLTGTVTLDSGWAGTSPNLPSWNPRVDPGRWTCMVQVNSAYALSPDPNSFICEFPKPDVSSSTVSAPNAKNSNPDCQVTVSAGKHFLNLGLGTGTSYQKYSESVVVLRGYDTDTVNTVIYPKGGTTPTVTGGGYNEISASVMCHFDLTGKPAGGYYVEVWNCTDRNSPGAAVGDTCSDPLLLSITVTAPAAPVINYIDEYEWGYRDGLVKRKVTFNGTNLEYPTSAQLYRGSPVVTVGTADFGSASTDTKLIAYFDLRGAPADRPLGSKWSVKVIRGTQTGTRVDCFDLNAAPEITVDGAPASFTLGQSQTVQVSGKHFQGEPTKPTVRLVKGVSSGTPPDGTVYLPLVTSSAVCTEGDVTCTLSGISLDATLISKFMKWNQSGTPTRAQLTASSANYYLRYANQDGQAVWSSAPHELVDQTKIYWDGTEYVPIINGCKYGGDSDRSKVAAPNGYLYLKGQDYWGDGEAAYSTTTPVDLTGEARLCVEWRNTGTNGDQNYSYLIAGSGSGDEWDQGTRTVLEKRGPFGRRVDRLTISLSEARYIRVHALETWAVDNNNSQLEVYKIWLEPVNRYGVYVSASPSVGGTVSGGDVYAEGNNVTVNATAISPYQFIGWYENGAVVPGAGASYTFSANEATCPGGNRVLQAKFSLERIYWDGTEYVPIINGCKYGSASDRSKVAAPNGYLYLRGQDWTLDGEAAYSTGTPVDLTGKARLCVEWRNTGTNGDQNYSYLIAGSGSGDEWDQGTRTVLEKRGPFGRRVDRLTISLSEARYIRVHALETWAVDNNNSQLEVYKIWLEPTNRYAVYLSASTAGGTVSGGGVYAEGTNNVTVNATPVSPNQFIGWYENGVVVPGAGASYTFSANETTCPGGNRILEAKFGVEKIYWNGTENVPIIGGFTSDGGTRTKYGSYLYMDIESVWLGSKQTSWSTDRVVDLTEVQYVCVEWENTGYNSEETQSYLSAGTNWDGGYDSETTYRCTRTWPFGRRVDRLDVSLVNGTRYIRVHAREDDWNGGQHSTIKVYKIWLEPVEHRQIYVGTATTPTGDTGGTASGTEIYRIGDPVTVTANVNSGYRFVNWTNGGTQVSTLATYPFTSGLYANNTTLVANFIRRHTITVAKATTPSGEGCASVLVDGVAGPVTADYNTPHTVSATAASGYSFINWTGGQMGTTTTNPLTFNVTATQTLTANFKKIYTVTLIASPTSGGTVGQSGSGTYNYNDSVTVTATCADYSTWVNWTGGQMGTTITNPLTFNITATQTLTGNFNNQHVIAASASPSTWGAVTVNGLASPQTLTGGTTCTLVATANVARTGASFMGWYEGGTLVYSSATWAFTVTGPRTLVAKFRLKLYWGPDGASANYAFHTGKVAGTLNTHYWVPDYMFADNWDGTTYVMRIRSWGDGKLASATDGSVAAETGLFDCSGGTTIYIRWAQNQGDGDGGNSRTYFSHSVTHNGNYNDGTIKGYDDERGYWQDSVGGASWTTHYIRVTAFSDAAWPYLDATTDIRVSKIWIE